MENNQIAKKEESRIKLFFTNPNVEKKFEDIIGDKVRSVQFVSSIMQIASNNSYLKNADPLSIYNAALMAATLNLPINQNLGFAYIVPYGQAAQFQLGYKGLIQLAQRSGQYKTINAVEVYANQFKSFNSLTEELDADFSIHGEGEVVGYACYFKLLNGFEKTAFWNTERVKAHAKKYSKAYGKSSSPWTTDFPSMAKKTVLKLTLSIYGPLSVEVQKAIEADQAVIKNEDGSDLEYTDHQEVEVNVEAERLIKLFGDCKTIIELKAYEDTVESLQNEDVTMAYQDKYMELTPTE